MNQKCTKCKIEKSVELFNKCKMYKSGYHIYCKDCVKNQRIQYESKKVYINDNIRICKLCKIEKPLDSFTLCNKKTNRYYLTCKICENEKDRKYRDNNKVKINEKRNIRRREQYKNNTEYKLKVILRTRFNSVIKRNSKKSSMLDLLGCNIEFFKKWISYQFEDWMSWENHGEWHLDHIRPCASFNISKIEDQKECFHWKNYRPISKEINISKQDKIDEDLILSHNILSTNYENNYL